MKIPFPVICAESRLDFQDSTLTHFLDYSIGRTGLRNSETMRDLTFACIFDSRLIAFAYSGR